MVKNKKKSCTTTLLTNKVVGILFLLLFVAFMPSCQKNNTSKIPYISLAFFGPNLLKISTDTVFLEFNITDGDGDLGHDTSTHQYDIYIKDYRFDTGYVGYYFPEIDKTIEDPKKGISGTCLFEFYSPNILNLRDDSVHSHFGDTTHFEFYVMDRAGNKSNHIITPVIIMKP